MRKMIDQLSFNTYAAVYLVYFTKVGIALFDYYAH